MDVWRVDPDHRGAVYVRSAQGPTSDCLGHMWPGDLVRGRRTGGWIELADGSGFVDAAVGALVPLAGMRVDLPVRRNGGTAAIRMEEARVERAVDGGQRVRLRLPGLPHSDLSVELLAGLLDSQPPHPFSPRPDQARHAAHFTSQASAFGTASVVHTCSAAAFPPAALAIGGGLVLGAGLVGLYGVAAAAVGLVRAFPRMTLGVAMAAVAIACQESEAQTAVGVPVPARAGPQPQSRPQAPPSGVGARAPPQGARFSAGECQVCLEPLVPGRRRTVVLLPCGHHCLHAECFEQLFHTHRDRRCPLCRAAVEATALF